LGENLDVLERKAKEVMDWRYHYENHSLLFIGAAVGAGLLTAALVGGNGHRPRHFAEGEYEESSASREPKASNMWDHAKTALVTLAATRVTEFVNEALPGFKDEFERAKSRFA
jgi:hypothetical protein